MTYKTLLEKAQTYYDSTTDTADVEPAIMMAGFALQESAGLVAALERLRDCDWVITLPDRMDAVREIAREALAKYRGKR